MNTQIVISHNDFPEEICAPGTTMAQAEDRCIELKHNYMSDRNATQFQAYFHAREVRVWTP